MTEQSPTDIYGKSFKDIARMLGYTESSLFEELINLESNFLLSLRESKPEIAEAIDAHLARVAMALIPKRP